jgi:hypothetical protein
MANYIVDIDGTIADTQHRQWTLEGKCQQKNWELFFNMAKDDKPMPHMQQLLQDLTAMGRTRIIYTTGRPERLRLLTTNWLIEHGFPYPRHMYMRADGDRRPDHVIKLLMLEEIRLNWPLITMAFDDRNSVVEMWRMAGIPCAQTAPGDF